MCTGVQMSIRMEFRNVESCHDGFKCSCLQDGRIGFIKPFLRSRKMNEGCLLVLLLKRELINTSCTQVNGIDPRRRIQLPVQRKKQFLTFIIYSNNINLLNAS
ncbi:MAG: hypothetical protein C0523_10135 [Cytophaga sp.]|nr:hypothetical protein [Cytophaga sp.]